MLLTMMMMMMKGLVEQFRFQNPNAHNFRLQFEHFEWFQQRGKEGRRRFPLPKDEDDTGPEKNWFRLEGCSLLTYLLVAVELQNKTHREYILQTLKKKTKSIRRGSNRVRWIEHPASERAAFKSRWAQWMRGCQIGFCSGVASASSILPSASRT